MSLTQLNKLEIAILKAVMKSKGRVSSYLLFKRMKLTLSDLMSTLFSLQSKAFVTITDDWVEITDEGKKNLITHRFPDSKNLNQIPSSMLRSNKLQIGEPYIPSRRRLDSKLLEKQKM